MTNPLASRIAPPLPLAAKMVRFALVDLVVALAFLAGRVCRSKFARDVAGCLATAVAAAFVLVVLPRAIATGAILLHQVPERVGELRDFLAAAGVAARAL